MAAATREPRKLLTAPSGAREPSDFTSAGLANSASGSNQLTQVGAVLGLGFAVPITGRTGVAQAAVNVHGWFQVNLSDVDAKESARYGFVFGPSITIGNVGVNL